MCWQCLGKKQLFEVEDGWFFEGNFMCMLFKINNLYTKKVLTKQVLYDILY
jgi:hypothetical protein